MILNILAFSLFYIFNCQSSEWTPKELAEYTNKNFHNKKFFILDPKNYITSDQKEVLNFRLEDLFDSLNVSTNIFIVDKIKKDIPNKESKPSEEEFEFDESINSSELNKTFQTKVNYTEMLNSYIRKINKELKRTSEVAESTMTILVSVEDILINIVFGKNVEKFTVNREIEALLEFKEDHIAKKDIFTAVDGILTDFIYFHKPKTPLQKAMGYFNRYSDYIAFGFMIIALIFYSAKGEKKNEGNKRKIQ